MGDAAALMQACMSILHALCGSATARASRKDSVPAFSLGWFEGWR